jgi:hypothetical protein
MIDYEDVVSMCDKYMSEHKDDVLCYPLSMYFSTLKELVPHVSYKFNNEKISEIKKKIIEETSESHINKYHKYLLIYIINENIYTLSALDICDTVLSLYFYEFKRIISECSSNSDSFYDYSNDLFCKDLAIATLQMFPAGVLKAEYLSGVPRRCMLSNRGMDVFKWYRLLRQVKNFYPYYEIHLDVRYREKFSPEGWDAALRIVGDMLVLNPNIKGITGASWFFDPQIATVTPRLKYLRMLIEEHGGYFFKYKKDEHTAMLATLSSKNRRNLYESGAYSPASYFMVWPRQDVLSWLKK